VWAVFRLQFLFEEQLAFLIILAKLECHRLTLGPFLQLVAQVLRFSP
jgi:hypothetical protein